MKKVIWTIVIILVWIGAIFIAPLGYRQCVDILTLEIIYSGVLAFLFAILTMVTCYAIEELKGGKK